MMREIIAAVRQAIPDAGSTGLPVRCFEHVLTALRAADAKVLDSRRTTIYAQFDWRECAKGAFVGSFQPVAQPSFYAQL